MRKTVTKKGGGGGGTHTGNRHTRHPVPSPLFPQFRVRALPPLPWPFLSHHVPLSAWECTPYMVKHTLANECDGVPGRCKSNQSNKTGLNGAMCILQDTSKRGASKLRGTMFTSPQRTKQECVRLIVSS